MPKYSMKEIKDAYIQKKEWEKQFPTIYFFSRPISFYLTYYIIRLTDNPVCVVWAGFMVGLCALFSFLFLPQLTIWPAVLLMILFSILDAVDGNIARTTKKVTYYGKFLDGFVGEIIEASYCLFLSIGIYINWNHHYVASLLGVNRVNKFLIVLCGAMVVIMRLYSWAVQELYYSNLYAKDSKQHRPGEITDVLKGSNYKKYWWYVAFINPNTLTFQLLLLFFCALTNTLVVFLFFVSAYYIFRFLVLSVLYNFRAGKNLA